MPISEAEKVAICSSRATLTIRPAGPIPCLKERPWGTKYIDNAKKVSILLTGHYLSFFLAWTFQDTMDESCMFGTGPLMIWSRRLILARRDWFLWSFGSCTTQTRHKALWPLPSAATLSASTRKQWVSLVFFGSCWWFTLLITCTLNAHLFPSVQFSTPSQTLFRKAKLAQTLDRRTYTMCVYAGEIFASIPMVGWMCSAEVFRSCWLSRSLWSTVILWRLVSRRCTRFHQLFPFTDWSPLRNLRKLVEEKNMCLYRT